MLANAREPFYLNHMTELTRPDWRRSGRTWARILLAGPGAIIVTLALLAGLPLWLPGGAAGIDDLALPLVLAPLIWAVLFFHACLDASLLRVALVGGTLLGVHGALVAMRLAGVPFA